jgi:Ca2+-binding EF-hand superfamily protein
MCLHLGPMKGLLFLGATLASAGTVWADDAKNKSGKDPAGTTLIMGQLRLMFEVWDKNKDGYLDPGELAKAFRGANARPHNGDGKTPSNKLATKYPDYQFLIELDQDHDGKISLREFEDWARSYAKELKSSSKSSSARSSSAQKSSSSSATKTDPSTQNATKTEEQIAKNLVANQKQQLHYLQEIDKQLKQMKHSKH